MIPWTPTTALTETPWGPTQTKVEIAPGLVHVTTSRHGGFAVFDERWAALLAMFPTLVSFTGAGWLEEDCDWALAVLAWPDLFSPRVVYNACRTALHRTDGCMSEAWQASDHGRRITAIADAFAATVVDQWETGGMSAPVDGHPKGSWAVHLTRNGERKVLVFPAYPTKQFYPDAEIAALPVAA
jgi:hypothetical protein